MDSPLFMNQPRWRDSSRSASSASRVTRVRSLWRVMVMSASMASRAGVSNRDSSAFPSEFA
jgi:hypothetical protein